MVSPWEPYKSPVRSRYVSGNDIKGVLHAFEGVCVLEKGGDFFASRIYTRSVLIRGACGPLSSKKPSSLKIRLSAWPLPTTNPRLIDTTCAFWQVIMSFPALDHAFEKHVQNYLCSESYDFLKAVRRAPCNIFGIIVPAPLFYTSAVVIVAVMLLPSLLECCCHHCCSAVAIIAVVLLSSLLQCCCCHRCCYSSAVVVIMHCCRGVDPCLSSVVFPTAFAAQKGDLRTFERLGLLQLNSERITV